MAVLNLGGGAGQMSSILEFMGFDVVNTDIVTETENAKNIKVDLNSASKLPLPEKSFDFVICQEVIEHLENPWSLFRLAKRYIKPKGCLILTTPNIHSSISKTIFKKTNYFKWFLPENLSYHINPLPFWEIKLIAKKAGFNLIDLKGNADYFFGREATKEKPVCVLNKNDILIFIFEGCK
jgi:2-polyprenyl-3-methyl-5-hydroxy-6-metoxy-1,4-benzoquinol methylase